MNNKDIILTCGSSHLLLCNHSLSFESFRALTKDNRKFFINFFNNERKPSLNKSIRSAPLYLFDRIYFRLTPLLGSSIPRFL